MSKIHYFAYGSNMLAERLQARCKSAKVVSVGTVEGHSLVFCKSSKDGSGKATLVPSDNVDARAMGVLFELDAEELADLDGFEGVGYGYERRDDFVVQTPDGEVKAAVYLDAAEHLDPTKQPYEWYLDLVLAGARQQGLPQEVIASLETVVAAEDPMEDRKTRQEALALLKAIESKHD